jgi:hypothetical protein
MPLYNLREWHDLLKDMDHCSVHCFIQKNTTVLTDPVTIQAPANFVMIKCRFIALEVIQHVAFPTVSTTITTPTITNSLRVSRKIMEHLNKSQILNHICQARQEVDCSRRARHTNADGTAHRALAPSQQTIPSSIREITTGNNTTAACSKVAATLVGSIYRCDNKLEVSLPLFLLLFAKEDWLVF